MNKKKNVSDLSTKKIIVKGDFNGDIYASNSLEMNNNQQKYITQSQNEVTNIDAVDNEKINQEEKHIRSSKTEKAKILAPIISSIIGGMFLLVATQMQFCGNTIGHGTSPTPTATPSIVEATIEGNFNDEETNVSEVDIYSNPGEIEEEMKNDINFIPDQWGTDSVKETLSITIFENIDYENVNELGLKSHVYISADVSKNMSRKEVVSNEELIANESYCNLTELANEIEEREDIKGEDYYVEIIRIRENAMELTPDNPHIALQLARNYIEYSNWMLTLKDDLSDDDKNRIFENAMFAIEMFNYVLRYNVDIDEKGDTLYRIGQAYHIMGNIPDMDTEIRKQLFLLSSAYYDLAILEGSCTYEYYDEYYAAMTNHKLGVISTKDNYFYLESSAEKYDVLCRTMDIENHTFTHVLNNNARKYQSDVYLRLANYSDEYGEIMLSLNKDECLMLSEKALEKIIY